MTVERLVPSLGLVERLRVSVAGRTVLVTGGAGSIGGEVCRQALRAGAARLVVADLDENGLCLGGERLAREYPRAEVRLEVANLREPGRVRSLVRSSRPDLIVHAAAHKHLPLLERCPAEAVKNNVLATAHLCAAALEHGSAPLVFVSTDKVVRPTSVLGATKRLAERLVLTHQLRDGAPFRVVRTGNVLDSAGSVLPLFRQQLAAGGPLTVTDREACRSFVRVEDAARLLLAAADPSLAPIAVLDAGAPVRVLDLARAFLAERGASGIEIVFTGLRPGERLREELLSPDELAIARRVDPNVLCLPFAEPLDDPAGCLAALAAAAEADGAATLRERLAGFVADYVPASSEA